MTKEGLEKLAEDYANKPYYSNGRSLSVAPRLYLKRGFIAGHKAALTENSDLQKKVYELEHDLMAIQEEPGFRKDDLIDKLRDALEQISIDRYPEDIFSPVTDKEWKAIHKMLLKEFKMPLDRLSGAYGRLLCRPLNEIAKEALENKKDIVT